MTSRPKIVVTNRIFPYMRVRLSTIFRDSTSQSESLCLPARLGPGLSCIAAGLRHLTCGRVAWAARTIMPLARGSAPDETRPT